MGKIEKKWWLNFVFFVNRLDIGLICFILVVLSGSSGFGGWFEFFIFLIGLGFFRFYRERVLMMSGWSYIAMFRWFFRFYRFVISDMGIMDRFGGFSWFVGFYRFVVCFNNMVSFFYFIFRLSDFFWIFIVFFVFDMFSEI